MKGNQFFGFAAALLLSTVILGGLWGQELKFDGYVNSGLGVVSSDIEDSDPILKAYGIDSEQNGYRFRLNGAYQNEAGNAGAKFRFQAQATSGRGYFTLPFAYGWVKFANDIFYAAGGVVDDGTWVTGDWWLNSERLDWGLGALLKATPVKGLDLGVGAYVINVQGGGSGNILGDGNGASFASAIPKLGDVKYTFNAAYTLPDVFRLSATFRTKNKAGFDSNSALPGYQGSNESSRLIGEFRFLGVKELTAVVAASLDKLEDFDDSGNIILSETFAYKVNDLTIGLNALQFLYNRGDADIDPGLLFNLWGSYAIGKIVPRLDLAYFQGGQSALAAGNNTWARTRVGGFVNKIGAANADDDYSLLGARPSVRFNLDARTYIEIGDLINYDFANFDGYRKDGQALSETVGGVPITRPGDTKSRLSNVVYVDFRWSF